MISKITISRLTACFIKGISFLTVFSYVYVYHLASVIDLTMLVFLLFLVGGVFLFIYPDNKTVILIVMIYNCLLLLFDTFLLINEVILYWRDLSVPRSLGLTSFFGGFSSSLILTIVLFALLIKKSKVSVNNI